MLEKPSQDSPDELYTMRESITRFLLSPRIMFISGILTSAAIQNLVFPLLPEAAQTQRAELSEEGHALVAKGHKLTESLQAHISLKKSVRTTQELAALQSSWECLSMEVTLYNEEVRKHNAVLHQERLGSRLDPYGVEAQPLGLDIIDLDTMQSASETPVSDVIVPGDGESR